MSDEKSTSPLSAALASNPQLASNPFVNLVLTLVLGGSAVGGFFVNNSQWAEVSADIKGLRQEMNQITIRLTQFDSKVEEINRLEASNRTIESLVRESATKIVRLEIEVEALKQRMNGTTASGGNH